MDSDREKRRHSRLLVKYPVRYRPINSSPKSKQAQSLDASDGGLCFRCEEFIPHGSPLLIEVDMPTTPVPVRVMSRVVRTRKDQSGYHFNVGIEFSETIHMGKDRLSVLIRKMGRA